MTFDRSTDLAALITEITTDPDGLGYATAPTWDIGEIADALNLKRTQYQVDKPYISSADVRASCTYDAYNNLSIDEQEWLRWITGSNGLNEENLKVTDDLKQQLAGVPTANSAIWAAGNRNEMNPVMLSLIRFDGSRAEDLFGYGSSISTADVVAARDAQ